jgi:transcriptional regulator with XRE-family HTH domain
VGALRKNLKATRQRMNLKQADVADRLIALMAPDTGPSRDSLIAAISKWENTTANISQRYQLLLSQALQATPDELGIAGPLVGEVDSNERPLGEPPSGGTLADPRTHDDYVLYRWPAERPLAPGDAVLRSSSRPRFDWVDEQEHAAECAQAVAAGVQGQIGWVVGVGFPRNEGDSDQKLSMDVVSVGYENLKATKNCLNRDPALRARVRRRLTEDDIDQFMATAPPGPMFASIAICNGHGRFLAVQRSGAVSEEPYRWTVGIAETLQWRPNQGRQAKHDEDLEALITRGLQEETGLEKGDYGPVTVSAISYCLRFAGIHVVSQIRTSLSETECAARLERKETADRYEEAAREWIQLDETFVVRFLARDWDREWVPRSALILKELHRMQPYLRSSAR